MALWEWALRVYAQPGVSQACLNLQDDHGQNTCLLLWAVWAEARNPALLKRAAEAAHAWDAVAITPLRQVRRALKPACPPIGDRAREELREAVKATELRAERILLDTLQALGEARGGAPALQALQAASAAWGRPAPDHALAALAVALD